MSPLGDDATALWRAAAQFLVVKAVETLAIAEFGKPDESTANHAVAQWTTRCQPPKLIDLMWHAHVRYAPDHTLHCCSHLPMAAQLC